MQSGNVSVARVVKFDRQDEKPDAILHLADGASYRVNKSDHRFEIWSRILEELQASNGAVYIEYDPLTYAVRKLLLPSVREIESLAPQPEHNRLKVIIFMAPSVYFIDSARGDYLKLRQFLDAAARTRTPLLVTVDPVNLEILDARSQ